MRPGARSTSPARVRVTRSPRQAPVSAKVSMAFQSAGRSIARTDWVTVCSSTLRAMAVIHSKKRRCPGRGKAEAKGRSKSCQIDQSKVACVMGHLLAVPDGMEPPGRFRSGDAPLNTIHIFRFRERIPGNYCIEVDASPPQRQSQSYNAQKKEEEKDAEVREAKQPEQGE